MYLIRWILILLGLRRRLEIVACSKTRLKVRGFRKAFRRAGVPVKLIPLQCPSGVSDQPIGYQEGKSGAEGRLQYGQEQIPNADGYISGESTMMEEEGEEIDQGILVLRVGDGPLVFGETAGLSVPPEVAQEVHHTGKTIGGVAHEWNLVRDPQNPHKEWTGMSRQEYYARGAYRLIVSQRGALLARMRR